ncbi:MAG: TolC family protein [Deltaproteobacteria bacterium]|nr:MAG: TolC family protein [Deltaproteobacteria bacterium]
MLGGSGAAPTSAGSGRTAAPAPTPAPTGPEASLALAPVPEPPAITLEEAMQAVLEHSFDLRIAAEQVTRSEIQLRKAWALLLPTISASASYTYNFPSEEVYFVDREQLDQQALLYDSIAQILEQSAMFITDPDERQAAEERAQQLRAVAKKLSDTEPEPVTINPPHVFGANVSVAIPLFNGRAIPLLKNAYEAVDLSRAVLAQQQASLLYATLRTYYGAVAAQALVASARRQLDAAQAHRRTVARQVELKTATRIALQRADLEVVRGEQQLRVAEQAYRNARAALGQLMAREEEFEVVEPGALPPPPPTADVEALEARALAVRPEIVAQSAALEIAERMRTEAWMRYLPSLSLVGSGRYNSNTSGFINDPFTGAVTVRLDWPLWDGGLREANLRETASRIREERLRLAQLEQKIRAEVRGNVADLALKEKAVETAEHGYALARATQADAKRLFELGAATSLDVIDANLAAFFAEVELTRAKLDLAQARLALAYVLGELTPEVAHGGE